MYSRRDFGKLALCGLATAATSAPRLLGAGQAGSTVRGVNLGIITGSLGAIPPVDGADVVDTIVAQCKDLGVGWVEFVNTLVEPRLEGSAVGGQVPATASPEYLKSRDALRQWRLTTPLGRFQEVRGKFTSAGINLFSYVVTISDDCTDPEIDALFKQMRALGVRVFSTNQTRVAMGSRLVSPAERYRISPAFHTHAGTENANEVASVQSLVTLMKMSPHFMVNLDIGHFTAGNNDAVAFIREHHARITHLHVKDRRRNNGPSVDWGTGDTPISACLRLIRNNRYPICCIIERDNRDLTGTPLELTHKYLNYMRQVLEG